MIGPFDDRFITEGELAKELNKETIVLGKWETKTPDVIVHDTFDLEKGIIEDDGRKKMCITNTGLVYTTHDIPGFDDAVSSGMVVTYILSNMKWTFLRVGFVNAFTQMIITASMNKLTTAHVKRYNEIGRCVNHAIRINSAEMFQNAMNTNWSDVSLAYFCAVNGAVSKDSDFELYRKYFAIETDLVHYIIYRKYDDLYEIAQREMLTEMMALLLKWRHEYESKKEKDEIGL